MGEDWGRTEGQLREEWGEVGEEWGGMGRNGGGV